MKIYVRGELIDTEEETVVIVFDDDKQRMSHANNMRMMAPKKGTKRLYAVFPKDTDHDDVRKYMDNAKMKCNER